jgi:hypothetical protein
MDSQSDLIDCVVPRHGLITRVDGLVRKNAAFSTANHNQQSTRH